MGDRVLAYLIDLAVIVAYWFSINYIVYDVFGLSGVMQDMDSWSNMAVQGLLALPVMFNALWQESLLEGQTLGKRVLKIKVIKIDGYQAGFGDYLVRWLFRIVEVTFPLSFIGLITMLVSKKTQRIGDMAAGTAVITLKNDISINHTILREVDAAYVPVYPLVIKLTDNDVRIIKETYDNALKGTDFDMIARLQRKVEQVTGIKSVSQNPTAFIDTVLKDYNFYTQNM